MVRLPLLVGCLVFPGVALAALSPVQLRCEYLPNPLGIGESKPRLSWIVQSEVRGDVQTAYRLLVASKPELLADGKADLWDSGRVLSDQTTHVVYGGRALGSGERAWWKVSVWDRAGRSRTSRPAFWEMGLLRPADWRAQWIGVAGEPAPVGEVSWIWTDDGSRAGAPKGSRFVRTTIPVSGPVRRATLGLAVDNEFEASLDGVAIGKGAGWNAYSKLDVTKALKPGENVLVVKALNHDGPAGVAALGRIEYADGRVQVVTSSGEWEASADGQTWGKANAWARMGEQPYGTIRWASEPTPPPHVRRTFDVPKKVKRARVYASARGLYRLFLDGRELGQSVFTPGWTDYRKRIQYQTFDVTDRLKSGRHTIGMILGDGWYCGHVGLTGRGNYGDRPQGLAQIEIEYEDGTRDRVATDRTWEVATGPILSSDTLMGEVYDARLELGDWASGKGRGAWKPVDVEPIGDVPLVAQHSQTVERILELKPKTMTEPKKGTFVIDLGQNMVGWARLKVRGPAGQAVQLRFAEMLNPDGTIYTTNLRGARQTDTFTLKGGGVEIYEPSFTFHGFRYVEVTGYPGVPGPDAVTGVVLASATPSSGTFSCSSELVNQLQSNIVWGQRGNYLEVPTDCPQRDERLGWMGDAQVFIRTATFNNDVSAFITKWMQDVVDAQSPAGGFPDVAPRIGAVGDGSPAWGDAGIIVPWTIYLAYGDTRILERHYDAMAKWIAYIDEANPDHIWVKRSNANYGDWLNIGADLPRDVIGTAYFAYSTSLMEKIARVLGKSADADRYAALFGDIRAAFNDRFVAADGRIKGDTQTAYLLALRFGLLSAERQAQAAKHLVDDIVEKRKGHLSTGFVGVSYLNPVLTSIGRSDIAYRLLLNETFPSWGYSIRQGATTIWERWDGWTKEKGFQDPGMNSFNHYSLGSVGEWMYSSVAGIDLDPAVPGYKRIVVRPQIGGGLTWAKGSYDSIHGRIESGWRLRGKDLELDVVIPANTSAIVHVPAAEGQMVREGAVDAKAALGVKALGRQGEAEVFEVGGGRYKFRARIP